ncbi:hypothetical protein F4802DRAFT_585337 [Xylaria palmicola]|nr:hypothetical protein F4802DRAFT_585337 [Xylaria palmicola]
MNGVYVYVGRYLVLCVLCCLAVEVGLQCKLSWTLLFSVWCVVCPLLLAHPPDRSRYARHVMSRQMKRYY